MNARLLILAAVFVGLVGQARAVEESVADSVRKYRFLAKTAREKKEYAAAIGYYREYLKYEPQDVKSHYRLGEMHFKSREPAAARQALNQALALDSLHVNANILLYNLYIDEQADSAATCLERVLLVKPEDMEKRRSLADLYRREGKIVQAIGHYEVLVEQQPQENDPVATSDAVVHTETARQQPDGKKVVVTADAEVSVTAAQRSNRDELIELIAVLYEDLGKTEKALMWRRRLVDNGNSETNLRKQREALETMTRLQLETGDVKSAFETLLELARIDSANRYSYYSRIATLAEERNDMRMRLKGWEGMVRANARDLGTVANLVEWYLNDDEVKRAEHWLTRGLRVEPDNAHLQLLNGDILVLQEDEEGALAAFEKAKGDPRWEVVAQQRIWQIRPPETEEEKLRKAFFGEKVEEEN